jgi:hypothetical protein
MMEPTNREALIAFFGIAHRWRIDRREQALLLGVAPAELDHLAGPTGATALSDETLERLGYLLRIDAGLQVLLPIPERADAWVHQPNAAPIFAGGSALSHMVRGGVSNLRDVADHLTPVLSGDFS